MVYECEECGYQTNKHSNFLRHKNRKYPCHKTINGNNNALKPKLGTAEFVGKNPEFVGIFAEFVGNDLKCPNCSKVLSNNFNLKKHMRICKGVDVFTCNICFKTFTTRDQKYRHRKNGKCVPVITQQNITVNNNTTNITNNTTNNNIVQIVNVFGHEDLSYLSNDRTILEKLRLFGKSGIYGLSKIIDDVHFNKERPENNTLIKPEEFGNGVMILNDDKQWEFREFEDIRETLINTIIKYIKAYNIVKTNLGVRLVEPKERHIVKNLICEFMALDGVIPKDLFAELNMDEDNIEIDEEEIRNKLRKFDKSTLKKIHNKTIVEYKRENGNYIKK